MARQPGDHHQWPGGRLSVCCDTTTVRRAQGLVDRFHHHPTLPAEQGIQRHDLSKFKEFTEGGEDDLAPGRAGPEEVGSIIRRRSTRDG
ncbi:hypothetical protein [Rhodococcus opacus]|uniref:hypothetical protein n=1 Tax=Rhodococcus opacus TaxID=37919 RepID=UPI001601DA71|nr:hypothetical protein [Rhodococcus opacus]QZS53007.1 hypothetical protein FXW36_01715 [Rhodococcus opacus]